MRINKKNKFLVLTVLISALFACNGGSMETSGVVGGGNPSALINNVIVGGSLGQISNYSIEDNEAVFSQIPAASYRSVAYDPNHGRYVAVGERGVITSTDGVNWIIANARDTEYCGVVYAKGLFIAVGGLGTIRTSVDGLNWNRVYHSDLAEKFNAVTYVNGRFFAVGFKQGAGAKEPSYSLILTSIDGKEWTQIYKEEGRPLNSLAYGDGKFLVVGDNSTVLSSNDGNTWSQLGGDKINIGDFHTVIYNGADHEFIMAGGIGVDFGAILTFNQEGQFKTVLSAGQDFYGMAYAANERKFVAVGSNGKVVSSPNGKDWSNQNSGTIETLYGVGNVNGQFIALGSKGTIANSSNGSNWSIQPRSTSDQILGIVHATDDTFYGVGEHGTIIYTVDAGAHWNKINQLEDKKFNAVAFNNGTNGIGRRIIVVGEDGLIFTSSNGSQWAQAKSGVTSDLNSVTYDASSGQFVAVGKSGTIITSYDGLRWVKQSNSNINDLNSVVCDKLSCIAVGTDNTILASRTDLNSTKSINWKVVSSNTGNKLTYTSIAYGNGEFVIVGNEGTVYPNYYGKIFSSKNGGHTWDEVGQAPYNNSLYAVAYNEASRKFIAVGDGVFMKGSGDIWGTTGFAQNILINHAIASF